MPNTSVKHGLSNSATYSQWEAMKQKCLNTKHPQYSLYKHHFAMENPKTHEFFELLEMIEELKKRVSVLESPETEGKRRPKSLDDVLLFFTKVGLSDADGRWFWSHGECSGWRNNGKPMRSWQHCVTAWKIACIFPSQKQNGHQSVRDLQAVIDAKQKLLHEIRDKYSSETASGRVWMSTATQQVRLEAKRIAGEIKELTAKISQSA